MPLDINFVRSSPDVVRGWQAARFKPEGLVDAVLEIDAEWRTLGNDLNEQNRLKKELSKKCKTLRKAKEDATAVIEESKANSKTTALLKTKLAECAAARAKAMTKLGNEVHPDTPVSQDEDADNAITSSFKTDDLRIMAEGDRAGETMLNHKDVLLKLGGMDMERGVKVAGHRAYFLKDVGVMLNMAIQKYAIDFLRKKEYTLLQTPYFMKKEIMAEVAQLSEFDEALYHVQGEGDSEFYLIATSEQPICGMHRGEFIPPKTLPKRYAGLSTNFRKESGSHGRDTWGIFRVHQFEKVEQFAVCKPENSWEMQKEMIGTAESFYKSLGLSYIVVDIVTGALNDSAARKFDLEAWFPSYNAYRELVSCSNCLEFQSRAIGCHMGKDPATKKTKHVHMLNATLSATTRTLCCIIENYQTADGVTIPDVLVPYMGGLTFIPWKVDGQSNILPPTVAAAAPPAPTGGDEVSFCQSLFLSTLDGYYVPHLCAVPPPYTFPNVTSS
jgi:seryl-tRNA synthetase